MGRRLPDQTIQPVQDLLGRQAGLDVALQRRRPPAQQPANRVQARGYEQPAGVDDAQEEQRGPQQRQRTAGDVGAAVEPQQQLQLERSLHHW